MWLRLSGTLYNMDNVYKVEAPFDVDAYDADYNAQLYFTDNLDQLVHETVEQIEQMLMGDKEWSSSSPSKATSLHSPRNSVIEVEVLELPKSVPARARSRGSSKAKRA
jgi:hypothetical protein